MGQQSPLGAGIALRCRDVTVRYRDRPALVNVSGTFLTGSMTAVTGANGAGKSTLLKALMGEVPLASGTVERDPLSRALAYLPQSRDLDRRFPITVGDAVLLGLWKTIGATRRPSAADHASVLGALEAVGLVDAGERLIGDLSVGQFQRVLFARLMVQNADVVLLDEPFAAIDEETAEDLLSLLRRWHASGRTIIAVLHDLAQVRRAFPHTVLLARRVVGWGRTEDVLTPDELAAARRSAPDWSTAGSAPVP